MPSPLSGLQHQIISFARPSLAAALLALASPLPAQISARSAAVPTANRPIAIYAADFNEDGHPDLAYIDRAADSSTSLHVLLNDGRGNFTESFAAAGSFTSLAVGDLMGNGHADIGYIATETLPSGGTRVVVSVEAGLGNGSFVLHQAEMPGIGNGADQFGYLAAGRLTQGGPLDLIAENITTQTLITFQANPASAIGGTGFPAGFTVHSGISLPDGAGPVAVADLDGDGFAELIVNGRTGYAVDVFRGSATGIAPGASPASRFTGQDGIRSMLLQDVDNDGRSDLIAEGTDGSINVLKGNGDGRFLAAAVSASGSLDLTGLRGQLISVANRKIDGALYAITATQFGAAGDSFAVADFNGDGNQDVIVAAAPLSIWFGSDGGKFLTHSSLGGLNGTPPVRSHATALLPTSVSLYLCVDPPGSNYPCGNILVTPPPLISPITMYYGQSLDGVAIESSNSLTGTLTFLSGTSTFCVLNANIAQGTQTCPPGSGFFPAGTTTVTAVYSGDAVYAPSTSNGIVVTVLPDITTATVTSSLNPATFGQSVTFTANVQGNYAVGAGQVIFLDGATTLGTATLDATGQATFNPSSLTVGTHPIRVAFPGSANFNSSTSTTLNQVILPPSTPVPSAVTLVSSVNPSAPGQSITFTATVTLTAPYTLFPVGNVTFLDGSTVLGTGLVSALTGQATFTTSSLVVGSHPITASYPGLTGNGTTTATILPSTSATLTQIVGTPTPPSFTLTVTPAPVTIGAGDTGILLVKVLAVGGFSQQVKLSCSGLPQETTCAFVQPTLPAGGGSTTLQVAVSAPHSCDNNTPYFVTSVGEPGTTAKVLLAGLFGGGLLFAGIRRRRRMLAGTIFLLLLSLGGFAMISGCGACTDLGTKPGVYSFNVVGTSTGSTEVESQKIPLTVTIP